MKRYIPKEIEPKWQRKWADSKLYEVDTSTAENKFYVIPMFPYPSGDIHVGHWYNFAPTDAVARWRRMLGHKVLHTNGFDAFGLPAENAAIKRNIPPATWTYANIASMTKQLEVMGASYDWTKKVVTCEPNYYKWTQWIFVELYKHGLAYKKKGLVNWCPKDQTVLANEQVVGEKNVCERCGTPVIQKELEQWYFKITDYADRLLQDMEKVDWPERVSTMQANWIGRSSGALIDFKVAEHTSNIQVFTTRPDTIYGATYMVLAPEHELIDKITSTEQKEAVEQYKENTSRKTELERKAAEKNKTGVFTGAMAINPASSEQIPIWIADYVLSGYGTGAIMAVPANDQRDWEFAKRYDLPIRFVIKATDGTPDESQSFLGEGIMINSNGYDGLPSSEAREKIVRDLEAKRVAKEQVNYKLRDWLISRQRYWGTPIPIVYCETCGIQAVPEDQLPVLLPENVDFKPTGQSPLLFINSFVNTTCPNCGGPAKRETDTMDTFVDSSWYFLRYPDPHYEKAPFNPEILAKWGPVDHYIGGIEHAILHLLYARFITKFLADYHKLAFDEPIKKLSNQGIILGPDGFKMSKSKGNVISPDEQVASYGADSLRLYLMFMGPYDQGGPYSFGGIAGVRRFLDRAWTLTQEFLATAPPATAPSKQNAAILQSTHRTIKRVSIGFEQMSFNVAIAALMEFINDLYQVKIKDQFADRELWNSTLQTFTKLLAPFAPHVSEELWEDLGQPYSVHTATWPVHDEKYLVSDTLHIVVQVNGKLRSQIDIPANTPKEEIITLAQSDSKIAPLLASKEIKNTIFVANKLVNFVVA